MDTLKIDFNPAHKDYKILMESLSDKGFCNGILQPHDYSRICKSFDEQKFIILYHINKPIGFTTWRGELQWAIVDYKWILPEYRGKGIGRKFSELIYSEFISKEIYFILAQPATEHGWGMSKSLGFKPLTQSDYSYSTTYQYLFLRSNREFNPERNIGYELLIWHNYDYRAEPAQIYRFDETMKINPIVSIVDPNAHVELRKDGVTIRRNAAKRFFTESELQSYGLLYFDSNLSDWLIKKGINL